MSAFDSVNEWIAKITDLLKTLVVLGIVIGILFDDPFGVIAGVGRLMGQFGDAGLAGLLALIFLVAMYPKRSEEHTSNSSHGYISYAVFCLKKKILTLLT